MVAGWLDLNTPGYSRQVFSNSNHLAWWHMPDKILLHSTEGGDFPSSATYGSGTKAPHLTIHPRKRETRQHYPFNEAAWALAAPGTTHTNTDGVIQIEIVGSCVVDRQPSVLDFDDGDLGYIAMVLKAISDLLGIPLVSTVGWLVYPSSYGLSSVRLTAAAWYAYNGVLGHMHAPDNVHGDPGSLNVARILELVQGVVVIDNPITPPPVQPADTRPRNSDGSLRIAEDGARGPATIGRWQEVMGTPIDRTISHPRSALIVADQHFLNSVVSTGSIQDLTGKSALDEDGDEGPRTVSVRQFWLYNRQAPTVLGRPAATGDFDGIAGPETTTLHQHALNAASARSGQY
jgi:hypothetical protein